jgi:hypothetical protein
MYEDIVSSFQNGNSLFFVFDYPQRFWELAQVTKINQSKWVAISEVVYVLVEPSKMTKPIECGAVITPHLDSMRCANEWTETFLKESWNDTLKKILRIQELRLMNYRYEIGLLEHKYNNETMRPFAHQIYELQGKINKLSRSTYLLQSAMSNIQ